MDDYFARGAFLGEWKITRQIIKSEVIGRVIIVFCIVIIFSLKNYSELVVESVKSSSITIMSV